MLIYLILFFLFAFLIMLIPIHTEFIYIRKNHDDDFTLKVYSFIKFPGFKINIPYINNKLLKNFTKIIANFDIMFFNLSNKKDIEIEDELQWDKEKVNKMKELMFSFLDKRLLRLITTGLNIKCDKLIWITEYGLTNPAYTGIFSGILWIVKMIILKITSEIVIFTNGIKIDIKPDFNNNKFYSHFDSIFSVRLGNLIITVLKLLIYKKKGGSRLWQNIQLKK
ncbi:MAG: DUF2953 domain-containing protein [Bacillota bacterium]